MKTILGKIFILIVSFPLQIEVTFPSLEMGGRKQKQLPNINDFLVFDLYLSFIGFTAVG